ncbi:hypothetical protein [Brucella anthropi]|uniref:hypothetical protein n=1 Tax=Brucella anthropi TaxID=529 RepID=UPI001CFF48AF|nr:hypothetical protein [Brucella anthropi]
MGLLKSIFQFIDWAFARLKPTQNPETTTAAATSDDDDEWADIRAKLAAENSHQKGNR